MANYQIFVAGQYIDPAEDFSSQFTYTIDDIRDFAARNTAFSKTIVLPMSARNRSIFGHIWSPNSGNYLQGTTQAFYDFDPTKKAPCIILIDGIQVFKGVIRILDIVIDEQGGESSFETAVFGELGGLVAAMGDKQLNTLDFSAYDHAFNITNIMNSWSSALGAGYYYGLIDYGYSLDKINYPVETFRPSLHIKEYIDKIFAAAGYTYSSAFLNTTYFKKLTMPFNGEFAAREVTTGLDIDNNTLTHTQQANAAYVPIQFVNFFTPTNVFSTTDFKRWHWPRAEAGKFKCQFTATFNKPAGFTDVLFIARKGTGAGTYTEDVYIGQFHEASTLASTNTRTYENTLELGPNEWVEFCLFPTGAITTPNLTATAISVKLLGQPTIKIPIALGDPIVMADFIPTNFTRLDLLKYIIKMFNLMIWEDKDQAGKLYIEPWINFYDVAGDRLDWNAKLDRSQPYRLKPMGELNSRSFEFKYKDDNDYYNAYYKSRFSEAYGSLTYDTGLEYINDKSTVDIGFSPTPLVGYEGTDRVLPAIYKKDDNGVQSRTAHNPRILFRSAVGVACQTWYIKSSTDVAATVIATCTVYPYIGHLDSPDAPANDLNFGTPGELYFILVTGALQNTLYNQYWSFYLSEITDKDSKLLSGSFLLTPADINRLDFSKIIFIDGALWRLNKVEDYTTDQPEATKCELLKVIDLV
jgi:hypothetical protein